jgi:hypothetical protein
LARFTRAVICPNSSWLTMKEQNASAQSQLARFGSGCAPPPGRGSDGADTSIYARANLQEVAALTLDRARECGVVPDHGTVDLLLTIWRHRARCRSLAQVSGSYGLVRRPVSAGAVAAPWCCTPVASRVSRPTRTHPRSRWPVRPGQTGSGGSSRAC